MTGGGHHHGNGPTTLSGDAGNGHRKARKPARCEVHRSGWPTAWRRTRGRRRVGTTTGPTGSAWTQRRRRRDPGGPTGSGGPGGGSGSIPWRRQRRRGPQRRGGCHRRRRLRDPSPERLRVRLSAGAGGETRRLPHAMSGSGRIAGQRRTLCRPDRLRGPRPGFRDTRRRPIRRPRWFREGTLLEGPQAGGGFSPPSDANPAVLGRWLTAARRSCGTGGLIRIAPDGIQ